MAVSEKIKGKLRELPAKPGVYLMRNRQGKVIYVGKAKSLRNRVRNYFQQSTLRTADPKIRGLINSIDDFDVLVLGSEAEATLTEGKLIKEYRPRYNSALKDDKRFLLLGVDLTAPWPRFDFHRLQREDGTSYFGPYPSASSARVAKDFVERKYGLRVCKTRVPTEKDYKHCLADILRVCSAPCVARIDAEAYRSRVHEACAFLRGERPGVLREVDAEMRKAATATDFERAAHLRDTLFLLRKAIKERVRVRKDPSKQREDTEAGLQAIGRALHLPSPPQVIEAFDISNISGTLAVAGMVVSVNGRPQRNRYRHFRIKSVEGPNDPAMMAEAVSRRYARLKEEGKPMPDLVLVDGGITQLRAAREALDSVGCPDQPLAGIAKRFEEVYWDVENKKPPIRFSRESEALYILQVIRDEAHRFSLSHHRRIRARRIRDSVLDDVPGIGDRRKRALLTHFGSVERIRRADTAALAKAPGVGPAFAERIFETLHRGEASSADDGG